MGIEKINGVAVGGGGGGLTSVQVLTSSGDYTMTVGTRAIWVRLIGGGGGGASAGNTVYTASGGAAGGYAEEFIASAASVAFVIGAGGTGNDNASGSAGGTTEFGSGPVLVQATGGSGGIKATSTYFSGRASGGAGSSGNILNVKGKRSRQALGSGTTGTNVAGDGQDSPWGGGGDGPYSGVASGYGAGGGSRAQAGTSSGGAGSPGAIIVFEYV
jgi:hypothetical protein